jgi:hypothetical protein
LFQAVEPLAVVEDLAAEGFDAVAGFFLLGGVEFFLGRFGIVVERAGKGG